MSRNVKSRTPFPSFPCPAESVIFRSNFWSLSNKGNIDLSFNPDRIHVWSRNHEEREYVIQCSYKVWSSIYHHISYNEFELDNIKSGGDIASHSLNAKITITILMIMISTCNTHLLLIVTTDLYECG